MADRVLRRLDSFHDRGMARHARIGAYKRLDNGGRIVVLGEGMASLFLGEPNGVRLSGSLNDPTTYWGKDSAIFMEEVLTWLSR